MQFARFARSLAIRPLSGFEIVAVSLALLVTCYASGMFPLMAAGVPSNLAEFAGFCFYTEYSPLNPVLQPLGGWLVVLALSSSGLTRRRYGSTAVVRCMARLLCFGFIGGCWLQAFLSDRFGAMWRTCSPRHRPRRMRATPGPASVACSTPPPGRRR